MNFWMWLLGQDCSLIAEVTTSRLIKGRRRPVSRRYRYRKLLYIYLVTRIPTNSSEAVNDELPMSSRTLSWPWVNYSVFSHFYGFSFNKKSVFFFFLFFFFLLTALQMCWNQGANRSAVLPLVAFNVWPILRRSVKSSPSVPWQGVAAHHLTADKFQDSKLVSVQNSI